MRLACFNKCSKYDESNEFRHSLQTWSKRVQGFGRFGVFDFHSSAQFLDCIASTRDSEDVPDCISESVSAISKFAAIVMSSGSPDSLKQLLHTLDGFMCVVLSDNSLATLSDGLYMRFFRELSERVFEQIFCTAATLQKLRRFNCDGFLGECVVGWRDCLDSRLRDHIMQTCPGWSRMEKLYHARASPEVQQEDLFDFGAVVLRTPIYSSRQSESISKLHVAYFRYLLSKKVFSEHILFLLARHNELMAEEGNHANESNLTVINNTPGRRGSIDSMASYQSADFATKPLNTYMEIFSVHCVNFLTSFGTGILVQLSNDLITSLTSPPTDFLRLMLSMTPAQASSEGHAAVKKYLASQLLVSLGNLVRNRSDTTAAEDGCLSFLMKAEMSALNPRKRGIIQDYRVVSTLVDSVIKLTVIDHSVESEEKRSWFQIPKKSTPNTSWVLWLEYLSGPKTRHHSPLVEAMVHAPEGRKELRSIYREIAAANVSARNYWESLFSDQVNRCSRMIRADFRLLMTTANGLGVSPVPVNQVDRVVTPPPQCLSFESDKLPNTTQIEESIEIVPEPELGLEDLKQRLEIVESVQAAILAEMETLKDEIAKNRPKESPRSETSKNHPKESPLSRERSVIRDDPISSVDEKIEAVFKRLAEGS